MYMYKLVFKKKQTRTCMCQYIKRDFFVLSVQLTVFLLINKQEYSATVTIFELWHPKYFVIKVLNFNIEQGYIFHYCV